MTERRPGAPGALSGKNGAHSVKRSKNQPETDQESHVGSSWEALTAAEAGKPRSASEIWAIRASELSSSPVELSVEEALAWLQGWTGETALLRVRRWSGRNEPEQLLLVGGGGVSGICDRDGTTPMIGDVMVNMDALDGFRLFEGDLVADVSPGVIVSVGLAGEDE